MTDFSPCLSSPSKRKRLGSPGDDHTEGAGASDPPAPGTKPPGEKVPDQSVWVFQKPKKKPKTTKKKDKKNCSQGDTTSGTTTVQSTSPQTISKKAGSEGASAPKAPAPKGSTQNTNIKNQAHQNNQTRMGARKKLFKKNPSPPPEFLRFPVIVEDTKSGPATLLGVGLGRFKVLSAAVGEILSVRGISNNKFLVGCTSAKQQTRLAALTDLGGIGVNCVVPEATTDGVIKAVPLSHSQADLREITSKSEFALRVGTFLRRAPQH